MNELDRLRSEINGLDRDLIDILARRMRCVERIAEVKRNEGTPTHVPGREDAVRRAWADESERRGLDPRPMLSILDTILEMSKQRQEEMR
ncbi:hypothetical protein EF808_03625 [archaeon]|nr:MAG: hypothetical protein EF808_03625 [archaeon]